MPAAARPLRSSQLAMRAATQPAAQAAALPRVHVSRRPGLAKAFPGTGGTPALRRSAAPQLPHAVSHTRCPRQTIPAGRLPGPAAAPGAPPARSRPIPPPPRLPRPRLGPRRCAAPRPAPGAAPGGGWAGRNGGGAAPGAAAGGPSALARGLRSTWRCTWGCACVWSPRPAVAAARGPASTVLVVRCESTVVVVLHSEYCSGCSCTEYPSSETWWKPPTARICWWTRRWQPLPR